MTSDHRVVDSGGSSRYWSNGDEPPKMQAGATRPTSAPTATAPLQGLFAAPKREKDTTQHAAPPPITSRSPYGELLKSAQVLIGERFDREAFVRHVPAASSPLDRFRAFDGFVFRRLFPLPPTSSLKPIGRGSEHAVYRANSDEVVKIGVWSMSKAAQWALFFGRSGHDEIPKVVWDSARAFAKHDAQAYHEMALDFPEGSVPPQSFNVEQVAVDGYTLQYLLASQADPDPRRALPAFDPNEVFHTLAMTRIQRYVPEAALPSSKHFGLSLRFLERQPAVSPRELALYGAANNAWILNQAQEFDYEAFRYCVSGTKLEALHEDWQSDAALREGVKDFVPRAIAHMNKTRAFLDVAADGNVLFDGRRYFLVDAYDNWQPTLDVAARALEKIDRGEALSVHEREVTIPALTNLRAINSAAHALGVPERATLFPPGSQHPTPDWERVFHALNAPIEKPSPSPLRHEPIFFPVPANPIGAWVLTA